MIIIKQFFIIFQIYNFVTHVSYKIFWFLCFWPVSFQWTNNQRAVNWIGKKCTKIHAEYYYYYSLSSPASNPPLSFQLHSHLDSISLAIVHYIINQGKREREKESSLTQGQIAEQATRGDSARGRAAYLIQQQVRRVLFEADRHADVVDAEKAAAGEWQIHVDPSPWPNDAPTTLLGSFLHVVLLLSRRVFPPRVARGSFAGNSHAAYGWLRVSREKSRSIVEFRRLRAQGRKHVTRVFFFFFLWKFSILRV